MGKGAEEFGVFGRGADGNANCFRETHPAQGTHDDAFLKKLVAKGFGVGANRDKKKIGFARNRRKTELTKFVGEALAFSAIHVDGAVNVVNVVESG